MLLEVPDFLTESEVLTLRDLAAQGEFVDGKLTAGAAGERIKHNEELRLTRDQVALVNKTIQSAIQRSSAVQFYAWPRRVNTPLISRYGPGMAYGGHFDNPIIFSRDGEPLRTDLSMTVFLSDPADYDGGDLHLDSPLGSQTFKLPAGHAFVYATTMYHQVVPVTRGTRLAAVTWIQSLIKEPERRQILYDFAQARQAMKGDKPHGGRVFHQAFSNLVKLWSEV